MSRLYSTALLARACGRLPHPPFGEMLWNFGCVFFFFLFSELNLILFRTLAALPETTNDA